MARSKYKHHPEQKNLEIYLGNGTFDGFMRSHWKTKRRGEPLDPLEPFGLAPWFVKAGEIRASLVRPKQDRFGLLEIKALRTMLKTGKLDL